MTRTFLAQLGASFEIGESWVVYPPPSSEHEWYLLKHKLSGIQLQVRHESAPPERTFVALERAIIDTHDWGTGELSRWTVHGLLGISAIYPNAMPPAQLREWCVTDGVSMINISGYPSADATWGDLPTEIAAFIKTVRFEPV